MGHTRNKRRRHNLSAAAIARYKSAAERRPPFKGPTPYTKAQYAQQLAALRQNQRERAAAPSSGRRTKPVRTPQTSNGKIRVDPLKIKPRPYRKSGSKRKKTWIKTMAQLNRVTKKLGWRKKA